MEFNDKQISNLRDRLKKHHGSIKTVADRVGQTPDWISRMLRSKAKWNSEAINVALDVCKEYEEAAKKKREEALKKMAQMNIG